MTVLVPPPVPKADPVTVTALVPPPLADPVMVTVLFAGLSFTAEPVLNTVCVTVDAA